MPKIENYNLFELLTIKEQRESKLTEDINDGKNARTI